MTIPYSIQFFTDWHTGASLPKGQLNSTVIKDHDNFPYLPGRTMKGLLRDAATQIHAIDPAKVTQSFIDDVFGRTEDQTRNRYDFADTSFTNAEMGQELRSAITTSNKPFLYRTLASTAIEKDGLAKDKSLRKLEVSIPLLLHGEIHGFPEKENYHSMLAHCFKWVKFLGLNRNRGLGRCLIQLTK
ncbi:MAG: RAMP superfamily CRISPR-associated protein [Bacteroidota bacterium]